MASILVSSEQRLVVVLFGQTVECTWTNFGVVHCYASGVDCPEGPTGLLQAVHDALIWIPTTPPRGILNLGPLWEQLFLFQDDAVGQPDYYGVHDGVLGVRENANLPAVLLVLSDWLKNATGF